MAWLGRFDDFNVAPKNKFAIRNSKQTPGRGQGKHITPRNNVGTRPSNSSNPKRAGYTHICDISNSVNHVSIIGVVIAKNGPRSVISKKGTGTERHLVSFTIRDSDVAFINLTCWGGEQYIKMIASELSIGDVVDVKDAQVQTKSNNPADEKFRPWTPSPCQLTTGENQGTIVPYSGLDLEDYMYLLQIPTRPPNDFYTLEDIQTNGMSLQGEHIHILAVVKQVWPTRKITMKNGKTASKVDVVLCDETCMSFNFTIWDNYVSLVESWVPMETVLFAADVKIMYNDYKSAMTASTDSRTVLTINPDIPEAGCMREYSKTQVSFMSFEHEDQSFGCEKNPPLDTIKNIVSVRDVKNLQEHTCETNYGLMYPFLSHFDIDNDEKNFCREVCSKCRKFVLESNGFVCANPNCSGEDLRLDGLPDVEYSLTVGLSDHTGTLEHCYVPSVIAEQLLGAKANEFREMSGLQKTNIKWSMLLERVKAIIKIKGKSNGKQKPSVRVLALEKPKAEDLILTGTE